MCSCAGAAFGAAARVLVASTLAGTALATTVPAFLEGACASRVADRVGFVQTLTQVERSSTEVGGGEPGEQHQPGLLSSSAAAPGKAGEDSVLDTLTTLASAPVDVASSLAAAPVEVLELGGPVLAAKVQIAGSALAQVASGSMREIEEGNLTGALLAAQEALAQAEKQSNFVDATTSARAASSMGIIIVICLIAILWIVEFLLTRRYDQRELETKEEEPHYLVGLGSMRYMMAWHVVLFNFYQRGNTSALWLTFSKWGEIGVPWFFVVSGFVNSYWKQVGPRADVQEDWFWAMLRRVATWYPLFVITVVWCAIRSFSIAADDWSHFLANTLLVHGLVWDGSNVSFPYVLGNWWLSYLMVYLLAYTPLHHVLATASNSVIWTVFTTACCLAIPIAIMEWWFMEGVPLFGLLQYWPSFVFGQTLAFWFVRNCMHLQRGNSALVYTMRPMHELPPLVRFGGTLSLLVFGIMYFCFSPQVKLPLIHKPLAPLLLKGGLLPLLGLQVTGLASEVDPIAKLFARRPFRWGEKFAVATFIFQGPVHNFIEDTTSWKGMTWTFAVALFVFSLFGHFGLEKPWRELLTRKVRVAK